MNEKSYLRFIMAIVGSNEKDINAKILSMALRDAGWEIIYLGDNNSSKEIIKAALQEDVDAIFLSTIDKSNMVLIEEILNIAKEHNFFDSPYKFMFISGLNLENSEMEKLKKLGITEIFSNKLYTHEIVKTIHKLYKLN